MKRFTKFIAIFLCLAMICALSACARQKPTDNAKPANSEGSEPAFPEFSKEDYPKMGGSLANLPLGQAVTATLLGISREDANSLITFAGSTTDNYKALVDGDFDILLAYEPSEEAKEYIESSGVEVDMVPIGVDALVFICSNENPVENLSLSQIKDIYSGKITDWSEIGGNNGEIIPYQRNKDSGSQTLFDKLVNLGSDLVEPPLEYSILTMQGLVEAVANYDNSERALGYTVYYYLTNMESDKLKTTKILPVEGVEPNNETIGSGQYPLTNDFYVVIRADEAEGSPARVLRDWITSDVGSALVERENYPVRSK